MATGFGLRLIGRIGGGEPHVASYSVPASDATALFVGDLVKLVNTTGAMDADGQYIAITKQLDADAIILGVVVGFEPSASLPFTGQYRAASTLRKVMVCDDPNALYEVQEDAVGGALTAAQIGAMVNCDVINAAGSIYTGLSGLMLDSSTQAVTTKNLKVLGVRQDLVNTAAQTAGAILLVRLVNAQSSLVALDSQI